MTQSEAAAKGGEPAPAGRLPLGLCLGWGAGGFGTIILGDSFGTLLMRYMTDGLGIAAATAATLFAGSKLYDAVVDPLIGAYSDRLRTPIGRRRPFLMVGIVSTPLALLAMFIFPPLSGAALVAYAGAVLVFYSTCYALWDVPYVAMPAEMTQDYAERTRLFAYKTYAANIGQLGFVMAGPWLLAYVGPTRRGYAWCAVALAGLALLGNVVCVRSSARARFLQPTERAAFTLRDVYLRPLRHRPFLILIAAKGAMFVGISSQAAAFAYFVQDVLRASDVWLGYLLLMMTASALVSTPFWLWLGRVMDKKNAAIVASLFIVVGAASWMTATRHDGVALVAFRIALKSAGLTGFLIYLYSMFTDVVEDEARATGGRMGGAMSGLFSTSEKICAALGLSAAGLVLQAGGYVSHVAGGVRQSAGAVQAIRLTYALSPAIFGVVSVLILMAYPLKPARDDLGFGR